MAISNTDNHASTHADICCIGHITLDKVITPRFTAHMPGGTAYYFAKALKNFPHDGFRLVTSVGDSERSVVDDLRAGRVRHGSAECCRDRRKRRFCGSGCFRAGGGARNRKEERVGSCV